MTRLRTRRTRAAAVSFAVCIMGTLCEVDGRQIQIGIVDLYGVSRVPASKIREALAFKEGDTISMKDDKGPAFLAASENRLARIPGVAHARINIICCEQGRAIVYVGIEERGAATIHFLPSPSGKARLRDDVLQAGNEFSKAFTQAIQRGDAVEDRSRGHALAHDPETRAIQERFEGYAKRDLQELRLVLRSSSDPAQRALAAQVLGYAANKQAVVEDLVQAMRDPSEEVRNNAMRALWVFAEAAPRVGRSVPSIPAQPFIELLNSLVWSDRNKASGALMALSTGRDPNLLARLRKEALRPLVEMARWKSDGHALPAFIILGRIAGYSDKDAHDLWDRGDREVVISAAVNRK